MLTFEQLRNIALSVGFDDCGVVQPCFLEEDAQFMEEWISQGLHGNMSYFERNKEKRYNPQMLVPGTKTIVVCILTYEHSGRDYHRKVKSLLYTLQQTLCEKFGKEIVSTEYQHIFCDSAPFLERRWAVKSGLGFIGNNHQFFHSSLGSFVHIGELLLNEEVINEEAKIAPNLCKNCNKCIDACPSGALRNKVWDARLCVAYETHHCLVCQNVCPLNNLTI